MELAKLAEVIKNYKNKFINFLHKYQPLSYYIYNIIKKRKITDIICYIFLINPFFLYC